MGNTIPDKNIEIDGKTVGANTTVKLSVKTALWILGAIVGIVMGILTYSYFDLKAEVAASQEEINKTRTEFINSVNSKVIDMNDDIQTIRLDQRDIKGDIRLILDRQTRDNPVRATNVPTTPTLPPSNTNE